MNEVFCKLTVLFEEPFRVGIFERILDNRLSVAKVTFGAEPKDYEIYEFILQAEYQLQYSPMVDFQIKESTHNPKRIQREAKKQMECTGVGTKSQQALKLLIQDFWVSSQVSLLSWPHVLQWGKLLFFFQWRGIYRFNIKSRWHYSLWKWHQFS